MTERLLKNAVEGNVTAFKNELRETFNTVLGEKLRKIESELYKEEKESDEDDESDDDKKKKKDDDSDGKDEE